jgi:Xaa-Pro aminopeptidase
MSGSNLQEADVLFAGSETSKDILWATRFHAPDPFPFFRIGWRKYLIASDLEIGRAREQADVHSVLSLSKYQRRLKRRGAESLDATAVLIEALRERGVARARVPHDFPVLAADRMREASIEVAPVPAPFWPERATKTPEEIEATRRAIRATEDAIRAAINLIRQATPRSGKLRVGREVLTSERVRDLIDATLREQGMEARHTIVAGGEQAVDPHDIGSGPLPSGYPIIMDVFPRCLRTGYHADITRTVYRGRPSKALLSMWNAVREVQEETVGRIRPGAVGKEIHQGVRDFFRKRGFQTGREGSRMRGYFHGTGHGLGLDVHEPPSYSADETPFRPGMIVTVEPGLYYPGVGGIRIEDDVLVTEDGSENLVTLAKEFVI